MPVSAVKLYLKGNASKEVGLILETAWQFKDLDSTLGDEVVVVSESEGEGAPNTDDSNISIMIHCVHLREDLDKPFQAIQSSIHSNPRLEHRLIGIGSQYASDKVKKCFSQFAEDLSISAVIDTASPTHQLYLTDTQTFGFNRLRAERYYQQNNRCSEEWKIFFGERTQDYMNGTMPTLCYYIQLFERFQDSTRNIREKISDLNVLQSYGGPIYTHCVQQVFQECIAQYEHDDPLFAQPFNEFQQSIEGDSHKCWLQRSALDLIMSLQDNQNDLAKKLAALNYFYRISLTGVHKGAYTPTLIESILCSTLSLVVILAVVAAGTALMLLGAVVPLVVAMATVMIVSIGPLLAWYANTQLHSYFEKKFQRKPNFFPVASKRNDALDKIYAIAQQTVRSNKVEAQEKVSEQNLMQPPSTTAAL